MKTIRHARKVTKNAAFHTSSNYRGAFMVGCLSGLFLVVLAICVG